MTEGDALAAIAAAAPRSTASPALLGEVADAYRSPSRHYHTLRHIAEVAGHFAEVAAGPGWRDPVSVFAAVLAHDAVYDVGRSDNEQTSAEIGRRWCREHLGIDGERCAVLILATASHGAPDRAAVDADPDLGLFLDCDLAILGASPERYAEYEAQIAAEYGTLYPPEAYRAGRRAFLEAMRVQPRLFHTDWFAGRYEAAARRNLERALASC